MGGMLRWQALYQPDRIAVICGDERLTWFELNARVNRCSNALLDRGVRKGDRLAVLLPNSATYLEVYLACAKLGVVAVPINYHLTVREIAYVLGDSAASAVIYDSTKQDVMTQAIEQAGESIGPARRLVAGNGYEGARDAAADTEPSETITGDEVFYLGYTSGTTGFPKGCLQLHRRFVEHYRLCQAIYPHSPDDTILIPGPLFHEAPTLFALAHLFAGGAVVVMGAFDPAECLRLVEAERCTFIGFAVPTMLDRLTRLSGRFDTSSVRCITTGGAALHDHIATRTLELFPRSELHEFYGATEIGLAATIDHRKEARIGSCGRPVAGMSVAVFDHDGREPLRRGQIGPVYVAPRMMVGYLDNDAATADGTIEYGGVGWFTLGDLGYLNDEGYLYLVDRKSHMIITGGENVYPVEVEGVLLEHPDVTDVAVLGIPDDEWGEIVAAVVVTDNRALTIEDVRTFCEGKLARYKMPRLLRLADELPRTPSGKITKHVLRQEIGQS